MAGLVELAKKVKKLGVERLLILDDAKNLSDLKVGIVVVALSADLKPAEHGSVALFTCVEVCPDGRHEHLRLIIPSRFYVEKEMYPCIMAYLGKKNVKTSKAAKQVDCYKFRKDHASFENEKGMYDRALELSKKTVNELNNMFNIKSFKDFQLGTVMVCSKLRFITVTKCETIEEVPVIAYR